MDRVRVALLIGALACTACAGGRPAAVRSPASSPTPAVSDDCSADSLGEDVPEPDGLPADVAVMRKEILKAAVRCDYALLDGLARRGDPTFSYSFGEASAGPGLRPGEYWREQERSGEPLLATMVKLLGLPFGTTTVEQTTYYVWPSAATPSARDGDWRALERAFPAEEVEEWRTEDGYLGYRLGITSDGDWRYFVAGD